uniref:Amino acid transporter transmembrane domain-containing protein n=1 Tax=Timema douglasi TaxID=61478 RepID=A0A7R8VM75_TIMDO|nr:unnamed protein product [Timema douglasi]
MESKISDTKGSSISVIPVDINNFSSTLQLTENEPSRAKPPESYNPFENRIVEHPNSDTGSLVHLLKCSLGTGILAMPHAFRNAGLVFGTVVTVLVGLVCTHYKSVPGPRIEPRPPAQKSDILPLDRQVTISDINCGHPGRTVRSSQILCLREKVAALTFSETAEVAFKSGPPQLKKLAQVSKQFVNVALCATCYSTSCVYIVFVATSIKQVMPLENSMKNPGHFLGCPGVLNAGMFVVVTLYAIIGFFGYLKYGESTNASVTLNLPSEHTLAQVVKILIAAAILLTYGLQYFIATDITWPMLEKRVDKRWSSTLQNIYRILTVAITVCVAIAVPNLGPIISLVGAVCYSTLGLLCPVVIDLVTNWEGGLGTWYWVLWKDSFIILFWLAALLTGTYTSVLDIITMYS